MEIGTVQQIDISSEMQGAYLDYAMSVIVSRALPDVRDGLKPVHRRILYAMHELGLRPDRSYKKSARIVGEVLGKYHPHGDAAVYDSMARMAQDFSLRYVLVDGQGNFGSIDGDSPAAMRYTEARLASIAEEILADIDKDTVDFVPNFDDTLKEPVVLPAILPNLLVNGASGIAVGMTTNIPPHNLGEVCDALIYLIDRYEDLDDVTVEDLTRFIQGPDFPTGGVVYRFAGEDDDGDRLDLIRGAYALGRGRLTVQANVHLEEMSRNRSRIVITELPYQTNKTRLIERIAELVRDGKLEGITDLRDESDRQGMRICIETTRTVEPRDVLAQLFKLTPMQTTFSMAMLALVDGEPRLLPLKRILVHYLEHRQEIIGRRSRHLLEKAQLRAHILEGLLRALDYIDEVIDIIRHSQTTETASANLMKRFRLSEVQAQAILDMPLKRLANLERRKIAEEHREKLLEIEHLQGLLGSPDKIRRVIREDLRALKARYGDARRTRIVDREMGHHTARDLVEAKDVLVSLWQDGRLTCTTQGPRSPAPSALVAQVWGNTQDDLILFTASGQAVAIPLHQLPQEQDSDASSLAGLDRTEVLVGAAVLPRRTEGPKEQVVDSGVVALATRAGRIKRLAMDEFSTGSRDPLTVMPVEEGDELGWVVETGGSDDLFLATRQGKAIRFPEDEVRLMGLGAAGVLAIKLGDEDGDAVVGIGVVQDDSFVILFTDQGYGKRTAIDNFPTQKRYGGGVVAAKLSEDSGQLAVATLAREEDQVVLFTKKGRVVTLPVKAIHPLGRPTVGYTRRADTKESYLDSSEHGVPVRLAVLAHSKVAAQDSSPPPTQEKAKARSGSKLAKTPTPARNKRAKEKSTRSSELQTEPTPEQAKARQKADETASTPKQPSKSEERAPEEEVAPTQLPLPIKSPSAKPERKPKGRKPRPVRSVPDSQ
jgi:DNA gyrase subunit A